MCRRCVGAVSISGSRESYARNLRESMLVWRLMKQGSGFSAVCAGGWPLSWMEVAMSPLKRPRLALVGTEKLPTPPIKGGAIQTYIAGVIPHLARHYELTVVGPAHPLLPDQEVIDGIRYVRIPHDEEPQVYVKRAAK